MYLTWAFAIGLAAFLAVVASALYIERKESREGGDGALRENKESAGMETGPEEKPAGERSRKNAGAIEVPETRISIGIDSYLPKFTGPEVDDSAQKRGKDLEIGIETELRRIGFDSTNIFRNLYVRNSNGTYSQIDLVLLSGECIFVIEAKNYSGWIFGDGMSDKWTQTLKGGKKYQLYNPFKQNQGHIWSLRSHMNWIPESRFKSIVVFGNDSEIKKMSLVPENAYICNLSELETLLKHSDRKVQDGINTDRTRGELRRFVKNGKDINIVKRHIDEIKTK